MVEQRHGGVCPGGGEEEAYRREEDEPEVAQDDDGEEVAREVQPQQRRPDPWPGTTPGQSEVLPPTGLAWLSSAG